MELLELAGVPEDRLRHAQESFNKQFPGVSDPIIFPYADLRTLTDYLERLIQWIPQHTSEFAALGTAVPLTLIFPR
jgi:hypothetical protein